MSLYQQLMMDSSGCDSLWPCHCNVDRPSWLLFDNVAWPRIIQQLLLVLADASVLQPHVLVCMCSTLS